MQTRLERKTIRLESEVNAMKYFYLLVSLGIMLPFASEVVQARTIYFGTETEVVPLVYPGPSIFRFPGEVRTISQAQPFQIVPADKESPNYALLSVTPRFMRGSTDVSFILGDGTIIKTRLIVVSKAIPEKTDSIYDFKSKDSLVQNGGEETKAGTSPPEIELMKAIIRGDEVSGYEVKNLVRTLSPGIKGVDIKLLRIYTGSQFNGYIFSVVNTTQNQKLFINVKNMMLGDPNTALLGSVDQDIVEPEATGRGKTYLRIVAKPTSIYSELKLPVQSVERK